MDNESQVSITPVRVRLVVEGTPVQLATIRSACALALMQWEDDLTLAQRGILRKVASTGSSGDCKAIDTAIEVR